MHTLASRLALALATSFVVVGCGDDTTTPSKDALDFKGIDAASMDLSANPCDDFYRYACGSFVDANDAVPVDSFTARIDIAYFADQDVESRIISSPSGHAGSLVSQYATACERADHGQDRAVLDDLIASIDALATPEDLASVLGRLHDAGASALFAFGASQDFPPTVPIVAYVAPTALGLPSSFYLDGKHGDQVKAYEEHITTLVSIAGKGDAAMAEAVVAIETALAKAAAYGAMPSHGSGPYHLTKVSDLVKRAPHFSWMAYFAASAAPAFSELLLEAGFLDKFDALLVATKPADLKAYLEFRALEGFADTLRATVVAEENHFHNEVLLGFSEDASRKSYCRSQVESELAWPLSQAFVEAAFSSDRAAAAASLMQTTRDAFQFRLLGESWLDASTRSEAEKKVAAMRTEVGGPATWPSIDGLVVDPESFATSQAAVRAFARKQELAMIGREDDNPWFLPPFVFNAEYEVELNAANVTAAFLGTPSFDPSFDHVVNAGSMGAVMGHEMTHGFDSTGRRFDANGVFRDWWSDATAKSFGSRADCLVDQYSAFVAAPGLKVSGERTLNENIADLGGLHVAYDEAFPIGQEARAFFIAYAQHFCESDGADYTTWLVENDPHSPPTARVNLVVSNMPEFATAFSCQAGTPMAPAKRCSVW